MAWSAERQRAYMKEYYAANKARWAASRATETPEQRENRLATAREYQAENKAHIRAHKQENRDRINAVQYRGRNLKRYGLTPEIFDATLIAQDGECAICQDPLVKPVVDHCHETNVPRALLCNKCNTGIGLFNEDPSRLRAAIGYMEAWAETKAALLKARAKADA